MVSRWDWSSITYVASEWLAARRAWSWDWLAAWEGWRLARAFSKVVLDRIDWRSEVLLEMNMIPVSNSRKRVDI